MMKTIYLMRHGQTLFNEQKKIQGFCDSPLTQLGIIQALEAKKRLINLDIHFDDAYSSTSERAIDTLRLVTDIPFETRKKLREWNFGRLEGEGEHLNPPLPYGDFFVQFGGESQVELSKRINDEVMEIAQSSKGSHIFIVSHGAAIANFYLHWESFSSVKRESSIKNCSIFKYEYINNEFILKEIIA